MYIFGYTYISSIAINQLEYTVYQNSIESNSI